MKSEIDTKRKIANELRDVADDARELALDLGLDPYPVKYWVVDQAEMNQLIAYGGFPRRYPHWRWGMKFDRQQKKQRYMGGKAFEIVNNDNPAHAFLQQSNSIADQKAVITHVEAHSDFFKNNQWFTRDPDAANMIDQHADEVESIIDKHDVSREEVERWIDNAFCLEDTINQYIPYKEALEHIRDAEMSTDEKKDELMEKIESLNLDTGIKDTQFTEDWVDEQVEKAEKDNGPVSEDVLAYIRKHGKQHEDGRAREFEEWQEKILEIIHKEAYYFAPQKMTKTMNEGWAAFYESLMMGDENFAGANEFIKYADHQSAVLNSPGYNPYSLGKAIWEFIENKTNRNEVISKLLRVEGLTCRNFTKEIDWEELKSFLEKHAPDNYAGKHYSLLRRQNRTFIENISKDYLEKTSRYILDNRYKTVEEAVEDVNYAAGWEKMREVRTDHNDITFIDTFLTEEFVNSENYFTVEYDERRQQSRVSSKDVEDIRKKLMLKFTNFGKPTIYVDDGNHNNVGELLLSHQYNGVMLDVKEAEEVLKRVFEMWGRPVILRTIVKDGNGETGIWIRYDGDQIEENEVDWGDVKDIAAQQIDYDTTPDEW
jgi:stage V sporulation protein R